jgi:hypothetical protein
MAMLRKVAVRAKRDADLDPWLSAPATADVYFARASEGSAERSGTRGEPSAPAASEAMAAAAWAVARETNDRAVLESFLAQYKDTFYAALAAARLREWDRQHGGAESLPAQPPRAARDRAP